MIIRHDWKHSDARSTAFRRPFRKLSAFWLTLIFHGPSNLVERGRASLCPSLINWHKQNGNKIRRIPRNSRLLFTTIYKPVFYFATVRWAPHKLSPNKHVQKCNTQISGPWSFGRISAKLGKFTQEVKRASAGISQVSSIHAYLGLKLACWTPRAERIGHKHLENRRRNWAESRTPLF